MLVVKGYCIISGFVFGIDVVVYCGVFVVGGEMIVVVGIGVDCLYLVCNWELVLVIFECGVIVFEFLFGMLVVVVNFLWCNCIIFGLLCGVLVIEVVLESGLLIIVCFVVE